MTRRPAACRGRARHRGHGCGAPARRGARGFGDRRARALLRERRARGAGRSLPVRSALTVSVSLSLRAWVAASTRLAVGVACGEACGECERARRCMAARARTSVWPLLTGRGGAGALRAGSRLATSSRGRARPASAKFDMSPSSRARRSPCSCTVRLRMSSHAMTQTPIPTVNTACGPPRDSQTLTVKRRAMAARHRAVWPFSHFHGGRPHLATPDGRAEAGVGRPHARAWSRATTRTRRARISTPGPGRMTTSSRRTRACSTPTTRCSTESRPRSPSSCRTTSRRRASSWPTRCAAGTRVRVGNAHSHRASAPTAHAPCACARSRARARARGTQAEELKQARKEREDLGVELYQVQQSLAKQQLHLEKTHENHNLISQMRDKAERELAQVRGDHGASLKEVKVYRAKYDKYKVRGRATARVRRSGRPSARARAARRARSPWTGAAPARARRAPARRSSWTSST